MLPCRLSSTLLSSLISCFHFSIFFLFHLILVVVLHFPLLSLYSFLVFHHFIFHCYSFSFCSSFYSTYSSYLTFSSLFHLVLLALINLHPSYLFCSIFLLCFQFILLCSVFIFLSFHCMLLLLSLSLFLSSIPKPIVLRFHFLSYFRNCFVLCFPFSCLLFTILVHNSNLFFPVTLFIFLLLSRPLLSPILPLSLFILLSIIQSCFLFYPPFSFCYINPSSPSFFRLPSLPPLLFFTLFLSFHSRF